MNNRNPGRLRPASVRAVVRGGRKIFIAVGLLGIAVSAATLAPASTSLELPGRSVGRNGPAVTEQSSADKTSNQRTVQISVVSMANDVAPERSITFRSNLELPRVMAAVLSGIPAGTKLSAGFELAAGNWVIPVAALSDLRLVLPLEPFGTRAAGLHLVLETGAIRPFASIPLSAPAPALTLASNVARSEARPQPAPLNQPITERTAAVDQWPTPLSAAMSTAWAAPALLSGATAPLPAAGSTRRKVDKAAPAASPARTAAGGVKSTSTPQPVSDLSWAFAH
jgi:hypothetical protein